MPKLTKEQIARLDTAARASGQDGTLGGCFKRLSTIRTEEAKARKDNWLRPIATKQWAKERAERESED